MSNQEPAYFNFGLSSDEDQTKRNYFSMFPEEIVASVLDAFIINKPMTGRAGGDGFWVHQDETSLFVAVFDCMGHGHLASMMTRVYTQSLDKLVKTDNEKDPGTILRYLHHMIESRFKEKTNLKVGPAADVGIVKIDMGIRKIEFSGAGMNLIQIEGGELKEIKGHKLQVGDRFEYMHDYRTNLLSLNSRLLSNIYLMSDGLKDLMHGGTEKRLSSKGVIEILLKIYGESMLKQKEMLIAEIDNWKGSMPLTDDILILGFAI
ncbi:PP2C family protein-serine/threonine phosphatase [Marinoscillum sp. MHG1-6]|uniref:PP2C family protein-serine/threonine phosphatase n=1 Tax=Marinoscillum sp. MHG1-6 TaxID=2959627 RepID=UPI0021570859|nr:serine/threonine-protein phosphatase [Marinoscillum sp. MHG1-6]